MATRIPKGTKPDDRLPGEAALARAYRSTPKEEPSSTLDATILSAARRAIEKSKPRAPFSSHWAVPLSSAAVIVLSLGLLLLLSEQGALNQRGDYVPVPSEVPPQNAGDIVAPPTPEAASGSVQREEMPVQSKTESPVSGQRDEAAIPPLPIESKKPKRDAAAPVAPATRERIMETPSAPARKGARTRGIGTRDANMTNTQADVVAVQASGQPGAYRFNVTVLSPDLGCKQYADWWEVVSEDGKLLYRRVLLHSHVDEQPFARSGGPIAIRSDASVWVRAHMNTGGYSGAAFKGSVKAGFKQAVPETGFAAGLDKQAPLPDGCDF